MYFILMFNLYTATNLHRPRKISPEEDDTLGLHFNKLIICAIFCIGPLWASYSLITEVCIHRPTPHLPNQILT